MTADGTTLRDKRVTYIDNEYPICKFSREGKHRGQNANTTFLVRRENIYFEAYSIDNEITWYILDDNTIDLIKCNTYPKSDGFSLNMEGL